MTVNAHKAQPEKTVNSKQPIHQPEQLAPDTEVEEIPVNGEVSAGQITYLQRLIGNSQTINFLNGRNQIQRCNGNPDCNCPKCRAKRMAESAGEEDDATLIHRAIKPQPGDTLTAPQIAGNPRLEAAFAGDKTKYLRFGQNNDGVLAVQNALLELNYQLPAYGADGSYGDETFKAITQFQFERGEAGDGIVGPLTLTKLNSALLSPAPPKPGDPGLTPVDTEIKGVFRGADKQRNKIFFDKDSASLSDDPTALKDGSLPGKIAQIANDPLPLSKQFTLTGLRSEDEPDALAGQRTDAVANELEKELTADPNSILFDVTKDPKPDAGDGNIKYSAVRMVAISETGATAPIPECKKIPCPDKTQLTADFALAQGKIDLTISQLSDPATEGLLLKYFNITPANKADTIDIITRNLTNLKLQLATHLQNETPEGQPGLDCGSECFESCSSSIAFVQGIGTASRMVLCPSYFAESDANQRAEILLHEGSHSIDWETTGGETTDGTDDHAYAFTRLNTQLDTQFALVNADSYIMFISELLSGGTGFDPGVPEDNYAKDIDPDVQKNAEKAVAQMQMNVITATTSADGAYSEIEDAQSAGGWSGTTFGEDSYALIARRFQLTLPPAAPTNDDQIAVAAIFDRVSRVAGFFNQNLNIEQDKALSNTTWITSDAKLIIGSDFITASTDRERTDILIAALMTAASIISANVVDQYVGIINDLRSQRDLAEAPVR